MATPPTAVNDETGETFQYIDGQWTPVSNEVLQGIPGSPNQRPTSAIVADNTTRTILNNIMAIPSASGDMLAGGAGLVQTLAQTPFSENPISGFGQRLRSNINSQSQQFPANALSAIPRPTVTDVTSAVQAIPALVPGGESPQEAFSSARAQTESTRQLEAEQRPNATMAGEVLGDVATLGLGRQPFARNLVQRGSAVNSVADDATREALEIISRRNPGIAPQINELVSSGRLSDPGVNRLFRRVLDSDATRSVLRGLGKAGETSLEGAFMAALKDNDPVLNAGLAGGTQIGMSIASNLLGVPSSLKGLAARAVGYTAFFRLLQEFGPNENDLYDAADTTFDKMAMGLTIGLTAQMLGGRFRGSSGVGQRLAEDLPRLTDAINTIPRGTLISLANQIQTEQKEGRSLTLPALEALSTNPMAFPEALRNRLGRALENGNFAQEVKRMQDIEEFTKVLDGRGQQ